MLTILLAARVLESTQVGCHSLLTLVASGFWLLRRVSSTEIHQSAIASNVENSRNSRSPKLKINVRQATSYTTLK